EAALHRLARLLAARRRPAQLVEVGPGDEHARLAAAEDQSLQGRPVVQFAQLGEHALQLVLHALAERVRPAAWLVDGQQGDVAVEQFQTQGARFALTHDHPFLSPEGAAVKSPEHQPGRTRRIARISSAADHFGKLAWIERSAARCSWS